MLKSDKMSDTLHEYVYVVESSTEYLWLDNGAKRNQTLNRFQQMCVSQHVCMSVQRLSEFVSIDVRDIDLLLSPILIPLFHLFVTGTDES